MRPISHPLRMDQRSGSRRVGLVTMFVEIGGMASTLAAAIDIPMALVAADDVGRSIGTITATDTPKGLQLALH